MWSNITLLVSMHWHWHKNKVPCNTVEMTLNSKVNVNDIKVIYRVLNFMLSLYLIHFNHKNYFIVWVIFSKWILSIGTLHWINMLTPSIDHMTMLNQVLQKGLDSHLGVLHLDFQGSLLNPKGSSSLWCVSQAIGGRHAPMAKTTSCINT